MPLQPARTATTNSSPTEGPIQRRQVMGSGEFMFLVTGTLVTGVIRCAGAAVVGAGASGKHERSRYCRDERNNGEIES